MKEYFKGIKKFYKRKKIKPDFVIVRHTDLVQDNQYKSLGSDKHYDRFLSNVSHLSRQAFGIEDPLGKRTKSDLVIMKHCSNKHGFKPSRLESKYYANYQNLYSGVHLTSQMLKKVFNSRWYQKKVKTKLINGDGGLVGASCHNREELEMASKIKVDYCLLSPVKHKLSEHHLITKGMGWESFHDLAKDFDFPIYALGGMQFEDLQTAKDYGAAGIAGVSMFVQSS
ncbi:thiamine phosphate synthase [Pseudomonadota bacterium]|nr:thiamine phosphate synthase [Pseudomonadota bacterium]